MNAYSKNFFYASNQKSAKKADKLYFCEMLNKFGLSCVILRGLIDQRANSVDPDEVAHHEPAHLDLHCLQIQYFHFLCFNCYANAYMLVFMQKIVRAPDKISI